MTIQEKIQNAKTYLGIEFGSTRIKAVLIDDTFAPIASSGHEWQNRYENGVWTYSLDDITTGLQQCYAALTEDIRQKFGVAPTTYGAIGISGMMHGYMAFDKDDNLLVPFRTWRNTITEQAASELSDKYCGDNAAMVGVQGFYELAAGHTDGMDLNAKATKSIEE